MSQAFKEIWFHDFEYRAPDGERPIIHCLVARELFSNKTIRLWADELGRDPPFNIGHDSLLVAYYASAEMNCFLALGWPMPINLLDLYVEFRWLTNGLPTICGNGLLGALTHFRLAGIDSLEKKEMRELAIRGSPFTQEEKGDLLDYCETDVVALDQLYRVMEPLIDMPRALYRGRYMQAVSSMEHIGTPIDVDLFCKFSTYRCSLIEKLIAEADQHYGVYRNGSFNQVLFEQYLVKQRIPWPRLPSGNLDLKEKTFRSRANSYPEIATLHELRDLLSRLRKNSLAVGSDGRNRCLISPFSSKTSRNQPSTTRFIFGLSAAFRGLMKPPEGYGIAYIDYSQQEFGIAAALSGDKKMVEAYSSGDPYLAFAIQAGAAPIGATKHSHPKERKLFKECTLAVQYCMGPDSLAERIDCPRRKAAQLLQLHRETYNTFWKWSDAAIDYALINSSLHTAFNWRVLLGEGVRINERSLRNFSMQANGAEILRLACILTTEESIRVCAPVHDALLIEAPLDLLEEHISRTQHLMCEAGKIVLDGFELRTDVDIIRFPDRYEDGRGKDLWEIAVNFVGQKALEEDEE